MNEFFENDSLVDNASEPATQEDFAVVDFRVSKDNSAVKSMTHRRQIEILRENKLLMSSLKDIYDF
jgi:hypothetical protein